MMNNTTQFKPEEEQLFKATRYVNYIERQANKNDLLEKIENDDKGELLYGDKDSMMNLSSDASQVEGDRKAFEAVCEQIASVDLNLISKGIVYEKANDTDGIDLVKAESKAQKDLVKREVDIGKLMEELADFKKEIVGEDANLFAEFLKNTAEKDVFEGLKQTA